ncbi:MAG: DUF1963 domain-containing protein [Baekduia sp.]
MVLATIVTTAVAIPPAGAPSRTDLRARAKALGLSRHADAIARDALAGARLVPGGNSALGATRLGGRPDLPRSMTWPRCGGRPLSFLAQLRLHDIAAIAPRMVASKADVLLVFAAINEDPDGIAGVEEAYGQVGRETCVVVRTVRGRLTRRPVPSGVATLRNRPVRMRPTLTVPDSGIARERYHLDMSGKGFDRWLELSAEAAAGTLGRTTRYTPVHQVLGWPSPVQDTPLYGCGHGRRSSQPTYRLFLQLDFDEPLRFAIGDGGALYLSGRPADLRAGRFGRLCAEFQEG